MGCGRTSGLKRSRPPKPSAAIRSWCGSGTRGGAPASPRAIRIAAHRVLADWSRRFPNFRLITQNVDGLHERAGTENTIRLHGSIWEISCWQGCANAPRRWRDETLAFDELPPRCAHCSGLVRPAVVWFGETLDPAVVQQASQAAECDVFITIGTSAVVYPAAGFIDQARRQGAYSVEINPEATPASRTGRSGSPRPRRDSAICAYLTGNSLACNQDLGS